MDNLQRRILARVRRDGKGKVFIPKDFLDLGSREAVDQALGRMARAGDIQRLGRGLILRPIHEPPPRNLDDSGHGRDRKCVGSPDGN